MNSKLLHTPEGVRDIYGEEFKKKLELENTIRSIFSKHSYNEIQTPTFEYFDVFSSDIGTTPSNDLYKFNDAEGNTLVLRPDFTPSIARCAAKYYANESVEPIRFCYMGNTFANTSALQGKLKEVTQMGAELMNKSSVESDVEMITLMIEVLKATGLKQFQISIGNVEFFKALCEESNISKDTELRLREYISGKNIFKAESYLKELNLCPSVIDKLMCVTKAYGTLDDLKFLKENYDLSVRCIDALSRLEDIYLSLQKQNLLEYITFDLGLLSKYNYYTGVVFNAYTYGIGDAIAKGGRYDNLLGYFGKDAPAIGFAIVVDDLLTAINNHICTNEEDRYLTFALGKGRLANKTMELLGKMGIFCEEMLDSKTRKLVFVNEEYKLKFFLAKGPDVPTYVEYQAADIGVVGEDTIVEEDRKVFEVLDLGFGKCRMCVCGPASAKELLAHRERIRVASKYPHIAKDYFYNKKQQTVDIIKLNGSVELGPIVELSDVIVDIVETGSTLRENGLEVLEEIMPLSARVIVNPVSMQVESKRIKQIVYKLKELIENEND